MGKLVSILMIVLGLVVGFAGAYLAMPIIRPGYVDELRSRLDSLGMPPDTSMAVVDSVASVSARPATPDTMSSMYEELQRVRRQAEALAKQNAQLASRIDSVLGTQSDVSKLAATLGAMEDRDLEDLVQTLDEKVLIAVYTQSSRKNQARLLSKIPPDKAARLIRALFDERRSQH